MPAVAPVLPEARPDDAPREAETRPEQPEAKSEPKAPYAGGKAEEQPAEAPKPAASATTQSAPTGRAKHAHKSKGRLRQAPLSAELRKSF
jgi:hypothetical protein